jgi:drug/metabolite transporter (DMT)-like permease
MSRRGALLFAAMSVIWGLPYLLIRVAVRDLSPATLVTARTGLAALLLLPFAARPRVLRPLVAHWRPLLVYTVVEVTGPWLLLARAEQHLTSSLSGLLIAATPLIGAALTRLTGREHAVSRRRLAGLLVGLGGVAALLGLDVGSVDYLAVGEVGLVATGYAIGPVVLSRRLSDLPGLGVVWVSLVVTTLVYLPFSRVPRHLGAQEAGSVVALSAVCTAVAFLVFFALIAEVGPARAVVITYVNPAIALLLGVVLLGERFTAGIAVGFPLVILGSVLATRADRGAAGEPGAGEGGGEAPVTIPATGEAAVPSLSPVRAHKSVSE